MYKAVKSTELIGAAWTKVNKEELAPNVTKIMRSTTNVSFFRSFPFLIAYYFLFLIHCLFYILIVYVVARENNRRN